MDADLSQWLDCSKMSSGQMEALIRLHRDAVEVQVRGPCELATSCFYFLEDVTNLVEQTAQEVAPGISLERHFLSPKHLRVCLSKFEFYPTIYLYYSSLLNAKKTCLSGLFRSTIQILQFTHRRQ